MFAWAADDPSRLCPNPKGPKGGGPEAVACHGVLRLDTGGMVLRFAEGRPVRATTDDFLGWVCGRRGAEGKRAFVLVWDNAAWPVSNRVGRWIARHDRRVRGHGGCRIRVRGPSTEAPWLNPIEPKWVHGKRAVAEPDRKLTADELRQRAGDYLNGPHGPPSPKPQP